MLIKKAKKVRTMKQKHPCKVVQSWVVAMLRDLWLFTSCGGRHIPCHIHPGRIHAYTCSSHSGSIHPPYFHNSISYLNKYVSLWLIYQVVKKYHVEIWINLTWIFLKCHSRVCKFLDVIKVMFVYTGDVIQ